MAGVYKLLYEQEFTNTNTIAVDHGAGINFVHLKMIIGGVDQTHLISDARHDEEDPTNKINVTLESVQSGKIQILSHDVIHVHPSLHPTKLFHANNGSVTQVLSNSFVTLIVSNDIRSDVGFANNNGEVTISETAWYEIKYDVSAETNSNTRSTSESRLEIDGVEVVGSTAWGYHRNNSNGNSSTSANILVYIMSGSVVRVRIRQNPGDVKTLPNDCRLTITQLNSPLS